MAAAISDALCADAGTAKHTASTAEMKWKSCILFNLFIVLLIEKLSYRKNYQRARKLISPKQIPCVNLLRHVIQAGVIAVGDDCVALGLEGGKVIDHLAAEEGVAVG